MAFDAYNDYEQSENVQRWLRQNGISIAVGVLIGLVAIFGWQAWRRHQATNNAQAAQLYSQARAAQDAGNSQQMDQLTARLKQDYGKSAYAVFAVADQARVEAQAGKFDQAAQALAWSVAHAPDHALKSLMQLRLARVQFGAGKSQDALATLDALGNAQYVGLGQELRGDVLVKLGRPDDARKAYEAALAALTGEAPQRASLQLKIDNLASAGKQGA